MAIESPDSIEDKLEPADTATVMDQQSARGDSYSAVMPRALIPIPPPPPLTARASSSSRSTSFKPQHPIGTQQADSGRTPQATQSDSREAKPHRRQGRKNHTATSSTAMSTTSNAHQQSTTHRTAVVTPSRAHPHPTRRRSKGKGAVARRKEKRSLAQAAVVPPVFSSALRPQAQPFVPRTLPPHVPTVTHVVHWPACDFPWFLWGGLNWSLPYLY